MAEVAFCDARFKLFNWNIKFPFFFNDCNIFSPSFSIDSCGYTRYCLQLFTKEGPSGDCNVNLFLNKHKWHSDLSKTVTDISTTVVIEDYTEKCCLKDQICLISKNIFHATIHKEVFRRLKEKSLSSIIAKDLVRYYIYIKVVIKQHILSKGVENPMACKSEDLESLSTDIGGILGKEKFTDMTLLSIDDKPLRLHRAIFAIRYSSLAKSLNILETPKKEYDEAIKVSLDYNALSLLLLYLYSGKTNVTVPIFELHDFLKKTPLYHFINILYSEPTQVCVFTSLPLKNACFTFTIPNFNDGQNCSDIVHYVSCDNSLTWTQLRILFYVEENAEGERCVSFKIQRMEQEGKLLVLGNIYIVSKKTYNKFINLSFESERELEIHSFIEINRIQEREDCFLTNGTLEFKFEVYLSNLKEVSKTDSVEYRHADKRGPLMNLWALRKDLERFFMNPEFSDISIDNNGHLIAAHKFILCARSPVLSRMLEDEPERKTIVINNYERSTVIDLLSYMYSGNLSADDDKPNDWVLKLYEAAKEYEVAQLEQNCIKCIQNKFDTDNVFDVPELPVECNDSSLQKRNKNVLHDQHPTPACMIL